MTKKKLFKAKLKPPYYVENAQYLNEGAEGLEKAGARAQREGLAFEMQANFDIARCLRRAASWLSSEA